MPQTDSRPFDLVVFGATGFAGGLAAHYLARHAPKDLRVALAGRSQAKLEAVLAELPAAAAGWSLVHADSNDAASLVELAASTRVVASTVGPFVRYGMPLVEACVNAGTDYADITGEVLFMRAVSDRFHRRAQDTGARIVNACGFDSIPSDLGVLTLHHHARETEAGDLLDTHLVANLAGGLSGGTIETMRQQVVAAKADASAREILADPYALSPDRSREFDLGPQPDERPVRRDPETGVYLAPFVMGPGNARVVRRSNALQGHAYGKALRYHEYMHAGRGLQGALTARGLAAGVKVMTAAMAAKATASLLERALPSPGEGPNETARDNGYFKITITALTSEGRTVQCRVEADGDPGYKSNATMIMQAALCLALDQDRTPAVAGVLTPATAMGDVLVDRLRAAGHRYDASTVR